MTAAPRVPATTPIAARASKLARKYADVWRTTGNASAVAGYILRHVSAKVTGLRQNAVAARKIRRDIAAARLAAKVPLIAVKVGGGLGDYLVMARYLRDLEAAAGPLAFDVYANNAAIAQWVFSNLANMRKCFPERVFPRLRSDYPLALAASQAVTVAHAGGGLEKSPAMAALAVVAAHIAGFEPRLAGMLAVQPFLDGELGEEAVAMGLRRADFLHAMSGIPYGGDRLDVRADAGAPARHGLAHTRYVTVQNGFDAEFMVRDATATKCYPHFAGVIAQLKRARPDLKVVQVGTRTSMPIPGVDLDLISKTSLSEVAGLVRGAVLHLDNEGGLVHLASCFGVPSCVVFGPTSADYFGYQDNINVEPAVCGNCWWATETWMETCPKGYASALCMTQQRPQDVAARILERRDIFENAGNGRLRA